MSKDIKYIKETGEFLVDNKVIKEKALTEQEKKKLKEQAKTAGLLLNTNNIPGSLII